MGISDDLQWLMDTPPTVEGLRRVRELGQDTTLYSSPFKDLWMKVIEKYQPLLMAQLTHEYKQREADKKTKAEARGPIARTTIEVIDWSVMLLLRWRRYLAG
jgi:hypothetical protein